jgi:excisionase family DNA binding protein
MKPNQAKQLLTVTDVAEMLSLGQRTIFKWSSSGEHGFPKPKRLGRIVRFRRADIEKWIGGAK